MRGVERQETCLLDHDARLGDALERDALLGHRLAERHPSQRALAHALERALGQADLAHAVVDATRAEAALRDLEAAAFAEQHVRGRTRAFSEAHLRARSGTP